MAAEPETAAPAAAAKLLPPLIAASPASPRGCPFARGDDDAADATADERAGGEPAADGEKEGVKDVVE